MRTTDSGSYGSDFFKIFSRHPGEISLTLKSREIVTGIEWELFAEHLTLDGLGTDDTRVAEVGYSQIETYSAEVDLGSPFGQYLTQPNPDPSWSAWEQHHSLKWFIERLLAGNRVAMMITGDGTDESTTLVSGRLFSLTTTHITMVGGVSVPRAEVVWVCHCI